MSEKKRQEIPKPRGLDELFTTQENRDDMQKEKIENIDIFLIDDFENHPFKVFENDEFKNLQQSIKQNGIMSPTIIRPKENGRYEMISGHRRKHACEALKIEKIPSIIRNLSDDEATILMVDSNLQREHILPSERAYAYKMKLEAMTHQGKRNDLTSAQVGQKLNNKYSVEILSEEIGESTTQIKRFIRLTELIKPLLDMVDNDTLNISPRIALNPAYEISFLTKQEQKWLLNSMECNIATPTVSQAQEMKELSKKGKLDEDKIEEIMSREKPNQIVKFKINEEKLFDVLPKNIQREDIEDYIIKAVNFYTNHVKKRNERER